MRGSICWGGAGWEAAGDGAMSISGLLALLDGLRQILRLIEATGGEGSRAEDDDSELIAVLEELRMGGSAGTRA